MRAIPLYPLLALACLAAGPAPSATAPVSGGLHDPVKKEIAMELVSVAENSSLDWRAQYAYIEYNVEHNPQENRGYTGGIIGFTSRTDDMLAVVKHYQQLNPQNPLAPFLPTLKKVDGTPSAKGLGKPFEDAWVAAATDPLFRKAQDDERDRVYFNPAVDQGISDGLHELGQFAYYDAIVMHGPGNSRYSFGGIRKTAMAKAKTPAQGGVEKTYIAAFLDARIAAMRHEQGHQDTSRVDTAQRVFLKAGNLTLALPLQFHVYGDPYVIKDVALPDVP